VRQKLQFGPQDRAGYPIEWGEHTPTALLRKRRLTGNLIFRR